MNKLPKLLGLIVLLSLPIVLGGCGGGESGAQDDGASNPSTLRVAILPDESASTIIKKNEPFKEYLEQELDRDVEIVVTTDYSSMIEATRRGRVDMAYYGPLSYVTAKARSDIEPFASIIYEKGESPEYTAQLLAGANTNIEDLKDVEGKTVAYGDLSSTSSHLIPKGMLADEGLRAGEDYEEEFAGSSDAVALAVQNGNVDFAAISEIIYSDLVEQGTIDESKLKKIGQSEPIPNYPWVMQSDLDPQLKKEIRDTILDTKDPEVLEAYSAEAFVPINDKAYDGLRQRADQLDLSVEELGSS